MINMRFCWKSAMLTATALFAGVPLPVTAQQWKPERPVELIVACAPGCGPDNAVRVMQRVFQSNRYFDQPITIQNKAGGGGTIARIYLKQFKGNDHYLYHGDRGFLAAQAMGRDDYTQVTPVAILFGEYIGIAVKADSPIKSGRDLIERLKKDPAAHSVGIATSLGNTNHQGLASALKTAGIDVRKVRTVTFQSGALAVTAMLGGHIDVVPVSLGLWADHLKTGAVRVIAVSSPERQPGFFSSVPTWREQGANAVVFNWRAMFGAPGITQPQVAYWENTFERLIDTDDWKSHMVTSNGITQFVRAAAMKKQMDAEFPEVRALLMELELAKK